MNKDTFNWGSWMFDIVESTHESSSLVMCVRLLLFILIIKI